jgi:hypothetical protein
MAVLRDTKFLSCPAAQRSARTGLQLYGSGPVQSVAQPSVSNINILLNGGSGGFAPVVHAAQSAHSVCVSTSTSKPIDHLVIEKLPQASLGR